MKGMTTFATALGSFAGGLAFGLLLAPQSGQKTRQLIAARVKSELSRMEQQLQTLEAQLTALEKQFAAVSDEVRDRAQQTKENALDQILPSIPDDETEWSVKGSELEKDLRRLPRS